MNNFLKKSKIWAGKHKAQLVVLGALGVAAGSVMATSTNTEFQSTSDKTMDWLKGDAGKSAAVVATLFGVGTAAVTKDFVATAKGTGIALVIPIAIGFINGAFTAVI